MQIQDTLLNDYAMEINKGSVIILHHGHSVFQETMKSLLGTITNKKINSILVRKGMAVSPALMRPNSLVLLMCQEPHLDTLPQKLFECPQNIIAVTNPNPKVIKFLLEKRVRGMLGYNFSKSELKVAIDLVKQGSIYYGKDLTEKVFEAISFNGTLKGMSGTGLHKAGLSAKEQIVLRHIKEGKTSKEIATLLGLSINTIAVHRKSLMRKLGVRNVAELLGKL